MGPDDDLPTLIRRKDHLNVLRYIRSHELREPQLVVDHGKALLGSNLSKSLSDESARLAALEELCLAALDVQDHKLAEDCLAKLSDVVGKESSRFRCLLARCFEGAADPKAASVIYDELLKENPSNLAALKRKYCLLKAEVGKEVEAMEALNNYLQQNMADSAGWYEMARFCLEVGDYKGAAYALEEVILGCPLDSKLHCQLGEVYITLGGLENLQMARKHMAQSIELDSTNRRALFGLVSAANAYIEEGTSRKKTVDEHELEVAKRLVKYGAEKVLVAYKGTKIFPAVQRLMNERTEGI